MVMMSGGQSYDFYLITTGLPIDPVEGTLAQFYFDIITKAIGLQADILLQVNIRTVPNISVTEFLPGYQTPQRNAFQYLIGVSGYSDPFDQDSLTAAIETYALTAASAIRYKNELYFDPISTFDVASSFDIKRGISGQWMTQKFEVFYSTKFPTINDGYADSIWIVHTNGKLEFYFNDPNDGWAPISDYGTVTVSQSQPTEVDGNWWIIPNFSFQTNNNGSWTPATVTYSALPTPPGSGNYWIYNTNSYTFQVSRLINTSWSTLNLSPLTVVLQSNNSNFLSDLSAPNGYNYTIDIEPLSLYGGPISSGSETPVITTFDKATAVGGVNETFTNFFTHIPIAGTAEVFVNGELQDPNGTIITYPNIQFIDSVNGFSLSAGDDIVVFYQYAT